MRVVDYAARTHTDDILACLEELYPGEKFKLAAVESWQKELISSSWQPGSITNVVVRKMRAQHKEEFPSYGVDGVDAKGTHVALDFSPWDVWRDLYVVDQTGEDMPQATVAALLYYEMTWHGSQQMAAERKAELVRRIEAIENGTAKLVPLDEFLESFKDLIAEHKGTKPNT